MARVIYVDSLFNLNRYLKGDNTWWQTRARDGLRDPSLTHPDLTVANVAARLARPVHVYTPDNSGSAA